MLRAHRQGSLGSLNALPQALMVCNTIAWVSYGLSVPNFYILVSNLPGAVAAVTYVALLLPLIPRDAALATAATTAGCACPAISGPKLPT